MMRATAVLALWLCACTSGGTRGSVDLSQARAAQLSGDLAGAERELQPLFVDGVPRERRSQVFWAGWWLAGAHARLAFEPPRDAVPGGGALRASHAQAALWYTGRARATLDAAPDRAPPELEFAGGRDEAALGLDLLELALQGHLGFDEPVARLLAADPELARPGGAERRAQSARLDPRFATRLELALFHQRPARAPAAAHAQPGWLGEREVAGLEDWIRGGAGRAFLCPDCRLPARPELRACPNDQTPLARFQLEPAASDGD
jgi:hypothetical protein